MTDNHRLIEGDGLVTNFYYFLWKRKADGALSSTSATAPGGAGHDGSSSARGSMITNLGGHHANNAAASTSNANGFAPWSKKHGNSSVQFTPEFLIPSTVIFEHNYPKAWYYPHPSRGGGYELERKLGKDIDSVGILRQFCPRSAAAMHQLRLDEGGASGAGAGGGGAGSVGGAAAGSSVSLGGSHALNGLANGSLAAFEELDFVAAFFSTAKTNPLSPAATTTTTTTATMPIPAPPPSSLPSGGATAARGRARPSTSSARGRLSSGATHKEPSPNALTSAANTGASSIATESPRIVVEYMNEPQLREFLLRRTRREDGFLQRWVWPNGKHNNVIEAVWSPHLCMVHRRSNKLAVRDGRESMYDRAVTYEGASHLSEDSHVAPHIQWQVEQFCLDIVKYMYVEHRIPVRRMVLYFKVDWNSQIWFLWASSVRVQDKAQLNLTVSYIARHELEMEASQASDVLVKKEKDRQASGGISPTNNNGGGGGGGFSGTATVSSLTSFPASSMVAGGVSLSMNSGRTSCHQLLAEKFVLRQEPETIQLIRQLETEKHIAPAHFPTPPSMGPVGTLYTWGSLVDPLAKQTHHHRGRRKSKKPAEPSSSSRQPSESGIGGGRSCGNSPTVSSTRSPRVVPTMVPLPPPSSSSLREGSSDQTDKTKKKKKSRRRSSRSATTRSPKLEEMLKTLARHPHEELDLGREQSRTSVADGERLHDVETLFGPHRIKRSPLVLWKILRTLVLDGSARRLFALVDAADFFRYVQYSLYSHFLTSEDLLLLHVPMSMANGIPLIRIRSKDGDDASVKHQGWNAVSTMLSGAGLVVEEVYHDISELNQLLKPVVDPVKARFAQRRSTIHRQSVVAQSTITQTSVPAVLVPANETSVTKNSVPVVEEPQGRQLPPAAGESQTDAIGSDAPFSSNMEFDTTNSETASTAIVQGEVEERQNNGSPRDQRETTATAPVAKPLVRALIVQAAQKPIADVAAYLNALVKDTVGPLASSELWRLTALRYVILHRSLQEKGVSTPPANSSFSQQYRSTDVFEVAASECRVSGLSPPDTSPQEGGGGSPPFTMHHHADSVAEIVPQATLLTTATTILPLKPSFH